MRLAVEKANEGIEKGQTPFGACIVKGGQVVVCAHNVVWETTDITAHAEIHAIRKACQILKTIDLNGCTIYSTCEPCPMCFSAIHWANIDRIVYGAAIADAQQAGFRELSISNQEMKDAGNSCVDIKTGILQDECVALFDVWKKKSGRSY